MLAWQKERGSTEGGVGHVGVWREGSSGCHVCITGLYFLSPQSRAGTVAASFFLNLFFDLIRPVVAQLTPTEGHFNIRK